MSPSRKKLPETESEQLLFGIISAEILVSVCTAPFLICWCGSNTIKDWLQEIGQTSEELFRGNRLPVLNFPNQAPDSQPQANRIDS